MENNDKLNRQELIELVTRICNADFNTEEEGSTLIGLFRTNVPQPSS